MARKFKGTISTDECEFEFEVPDDATVDDIEHEGREAAFDLVTWSYTEIEQ